MKPCEHLSQYLDGRMERAGREYFEGHLDTCSECQGILDMWQSAKRRLNSEAGHRWQRLTPTMDEANRLVERAKLESTARDTWNPRFLFPVAVTASVTFAVAWILFGSFEASNETDISPTEALAEIQDVASYSSMVNEPSRAEKSISYIATETGFTVGTLGKDRFGLGASSELKLVSVNNGITRLRLKDGFAVFSVSPRKQGEKFIVDAGNVTVQVIGTRFSVVRSDREVRVSVVEGKVEVANQDGRLWNVNPGEVLLVNRLGVADLSELDELEGFKMARLLGETVPDAVLALISPASKEAPSGDRAMVFDVDEAVRRPRASKPRPPKSPRVKADEIFVPSPPSNAPEAKANTRDESVDSPDENSPEPIGIDQWREWVLEGKLKEAEGALRSYLKRHPLDTDAYSLLANCQRKAKKYSDAVNTYKNLIAIANVSQANRARFKAGVLLQEQMGDHFGAATIFEAYLSTGKGSPLLTAKAMVRLARSLISLKERSRAKYLLQQVITDHSGTSAAIKAREILEQLP